MASRKVRHGVKYALLGLLMQHGRLYGYSLATRVDVLLGDAASISSGLVYTSLDALEREGLIESVGEKPGTGKRSPRVLYSVTEAGYEALMQWFRDHYFEPVRWDLPAKLALVRPDQTSELLERIDVAEEECVDLVARLSERVAEVADHPWHGPFVRLAHKYGSGQLQGRISWLQEARSLVEQQQKKHTNGDF